MSTPFVSIALASPKEARRRLMLRVVNAVFGALGLIALGVLIRSVGAPILLAILWRSARFLPLLIGLDVLRIGFEALGTRLLLREPRRISSATLARMHLLAQAIGSIMPAGRAAGEAFKATALSRVIGAPRAFAIAATNQSIALLGGAIIALPCIAAAYGLTGSSPFTGALALYALATFAGFTLLQIVCRRQEIGGFLGRRFARMRRATASFHDALADIPILPVGTLLCMVCNRAVQVVQFGILIFVVGAATGVGPALLGQGVSLLGSSAGDLIPGQFGAMDAAFALAAPTLGMSAASAVSVSVMIHGLQLFWALVGALVPLVWRERAAEKSLAR